MGNEICLDGIRLVSWDVDGTLFSYLRLTLELFRSRALRLNYVAELWEFHRSIEKQRRTAGCRVDLVEMERIRGPQQRERAALQHALGHIRPRRSAVEFMRKLSSRGIAQVALSDFECGYKLQALGLSEYFEKSYSCEDLGFWKPSPIPLSRIQAEFGVHPDQHLHIGDRLDTDGEASFRNGCRFMLIDRSPRLWRTFNKMCSI
jgi:FMN phosphatase YigB (HAD superfamily)